MKVLVTLLALLAIAAIADTASAGSIADKKIWAKADENFAKETAYTKEKCGAEIPMKVDRESFKSQEAIKVVGWCANFIHHVGYICDSSDMKGMKPDIVKAVGSVNCHYDGTLKKEGSKSLYGKKFEHKGTEFHVWFNENSANLDDFRDWMRKEL